jgi:hypothetical protein
VSRRQDARERLSRSRRRREDVAELSEWRLPLSIPILVDDQ